MRVLGRRGVSRLTHQYTTAVQGLSDRRLSRRVGALHTLALLGAESGAHRPAVLDVICAFLRTPGADVATRETAQRLLRERLQPIRPEFWPGMSVDLSGAILTDLDLSQCRIDGDLRLDGCQLLGQTRLRGLVVGGTTIIRAARFEDHAWLERATFVGPIWLNGTVFSGDAWFGDAMFGGYASFAGVSFAGHAWFGGASFDQPVDFGEAVFHRSAGFRGVVARRPVSLAGTTFHGPARVSRRGSEWNISAPGWRVVVDDDNRSVGRLLWVGRRDLIERPALLEEPTTV
jgi:Pentapeptide repeats (9 copies)